MSPCNYKLYPKDWKAIRQRILYRDGHQCKECGVGNGLIGYRDREGKFYSSERVEYELEIRGHDLFDDVLSNCFDKKGNPTKAIKIVLTIAHLDHDLKNNESSNLKALCQRCHLLFDAVQHRTNAKETNRKKKGLQNLF